MDSAQYVPGGWGAQQPAPPQQQHQQSFGGGGPSASYDLGGNDPNMQAMAGLAKAGFGAYGEKLYGKGHSFMTKYFPGKASMLPYLNVTGKYVLNKLSLLMCPFLTKGDWRRVARSGGGGMGGMFAHPREDLQAPDLYLPIMGLFTYCLVASLAQVLGERFNPEMLRARVTTGVMAWCFATAMMWGCLKAVGGQSKPPVLDLVAYSGYLFVYLAIQNFLGLFSSTLYYVVWLYTCVAFAFFLVKTSKRTIAQTEARHDEGGITNYVLLCLVLVQFPLSYWLGVLP